MIRRAAILAALCAAATACAGSAAGPVGTLRFANQPPVWKVDDRRDVPERPAERPDYVMLDGFDSTVYRRITRPMEVPAPRHAMSVNALDQVPDSTWFTNRIGRHELGPEDIARGPVATGRSEGGPDLSGTLTIVSGKAGGASPGFIIEDARGDRYIVKFDNPRAPIMETATDVVVQRILWAAGYHVSNNAIGYFGREQLALAPDAKVASPLGRKRPMTWDDVERTLGQVHRREDGSYRALFSQFLPGIPIGGIPQEGVRADDPNDTIPHEHRRELRGLGLFVSWLQHTDMKEGNTLDIYAADPASPDRHYVIHYLVDFGKSLGAFVLLGYRPADGHVEAADKHYLQSALAFGLWKRPWEGTPRPKLRGVPHFDVAHYRPDDFSPHAPFIPFLVADRHDMLWAANIMLRFTEAHLRAALAQGQYDDPRAIDYLARVLVGRQRKAARYWLSKTSPLVDFALAGGAPGSDDPGGPRLCFTDLLVAHRLIDDAAARSRYGAATFDFDGRPLGWSARVRASAQAGPTACVQGFAAAPDHDGYTIVRLDAYRDNGPLPAVEIHLARTPDSGRLRIVGLHRR